MSEIVAARANIFLAAKNTRNIYYGALGPELDNIHRALKIRFSYWPASAISQELRSVEFDDDPSNSLAVHFETPKKYEEQ